MSMPRTNAASVLQRGFSAATRLQQENRVIVNIWSSEENKAIPGANVGHISLETPTSYISLWPGPRGREVRNLNKLEKTWRRYFSKRPASWKANYAEDCLYEAISEDHCREIAHADQVLEGETLVVDTEEGFRIADVDDFILEEGQSLMAIVLLEPTVRIALYGLDTGGILDKFENLHRTCKGWNLAGSNFFTRLSTGGGENCSSLAYRTLCAGNMYRGLDKATACSQTSSVTTPDMLIRHVMRAKEKELTEHAECREWTFPGESDLLKLQQNYKLEPDTIINKFCTIM